MPRRTHRGTARCEPLDRRLLFAAATTYGTYPLAPAAGLADVDNVSPATADGTVYFTATASGTPQLWRTDGTPEATAVVGPLPADYRGQPFATELTFAGDHLFAADPAVAGFLVADGSAAVAVAGPVVTTAVAAGDDVFFDGVAGSTHGLWRTNGTAAGTALLADVQPLAMSAVGRNLFFFTSDADGLHLWTATGTSTTPTELATVNAAANPGAPSAGQTAADGDQLFFVAPTGPTGTTAALWTSDGTRSGTRLLNDTLAYATTAPLFATAGRPVYDGDVLQGVDPTTGVASRLMPAQVDPFKATGGAWIVGPTLDGGLLFEPKFVGQAAGFATIGGSAPAGWWTTDGTAAGTRPVGPSVRSPSADASRSVGGIVSFSYGRAVPFAGGFAYVAEGRAGLSVLYADASVPLAGGIGLGLLAVGGVAAAGRGLVFVGASSTADANPQLYAAGTDGITAAATQDATGPAVAVDPLDAADATFTVHFSDPSGFQIPPGGPRLKLDDSTVVSNTYVPPDLTPIRTTLGDGGRSLTATYAAVGLRAGVTYNVLAGSNTLFDMADNGLAYYAHLGSITTPAAVVPTPTPEPTPTPTPTPTRTPTPVAIATADAGAGVMAVIGSTELIAGTPSAVRLTRVAGRSSADRRLAVTLYLSAVGQPPVATDPIVGRTAVANRGVGHAAAGRATLVLPVATPAGTYQLTAVLAATPGSAAVYIAGPTVTVRPATVDVAAAPLASASPRVVRVRLTNDGNTAANGTATVTVAAAGATIGTVARLVRLRPGRSTVVAVPVILPPAGGPITVTVTPDVAWPDDPTAADKRFSLATN